MKKHGVLLAIVTRIGRWLGVSMIFWMLKGCIRF